MDDDLYQYKLYKVLVTEGDIPIDLSKVTIIDKRFLDVVLFVLELFPTKSHLIFKRLWTIVPPDKVAAKLADILKHSIESRIITCEHSQSNRYMYALARVLCLMQFLGQLSEYFDPVQYIETFEFGKLKDPYLECVMLFISTAKSTLSPEFIVKLKSYITESSDPKLYLSMLETILNHLCYQPTTLVKSCWNVLMSMDLERWVKTQLMPNVYLITERLIKEKGDALSFIETFLSQQISPEHKRYYTNHTLLVACTEGNESVVRAMTSNKFGAQLDSMDANFNPALHCACKNGHLDCVKILVDEAGDLVDRQSSSPSSSGATPLHAAVFGGYLNVVKFLVEEKGTNPNPMAVDGTTPLHLACARNFPDIVRYFIIVKQLDPFVILIPTQISPFQAAALFGCEASMTSIYDAAVIERPSRCLAEPVFVSQLFRGMLLTLSAVAGVQRSDQQQDNDRANILQILLQMASPSSITHILSMSYQGTGENTNERKGDTLLHIGARLGRAKCVKLLLQAGADVTLRNGNGQTPVDCGFSFVSKLAKDDPAALAKNGTATVLVQHWEQLRKRADTTMESIVTDMENDKPSKKKLSSIHNKKKKKKKTKKHVPIVEESEESEVEVTTSFINHANEEILSTGWSEPISGKVRFKDTKPEVVVDKTLANMLEKSILESLHTPEPIVQSDIVREPECNHFEMFGPMSDSFLPPLFSKDSIGNAMKEIAWQGKWLSEPFQYLPESILDEITPPSTAWDRDYPEFQSLGLEQHHVLGRDLEILSNAQLDALREFHSREMSRIVEVQLQLAREQGKAVAEENLRLAQFT